MINNGLRNEIEDLCKIYVIVLMIMFLVKLIIFIIILGDDGPDNVLRNSI